MAHPSDDDTDPTDALDALSTGQMFGEHYRLTARLDRGKTSAVWRADDLRTGKPCVLKLFAGLAATQAAALRQDLEAARGIKHPGLCRILDVGQHEALIYQASELLIGESLKERLAQDGFGADLSFLALHQVAAALDAAHQRGLWHGRLRPTQVMLLAHDQVVVLGLGQRRCDQLTRATRGQGEAHQASLDEGEREVSPLNDMPGQILPGYSPPEQTAGKGLGLPSDVYGLGLLIRHMLTGQTELAKALGTPLYAPGLSASNLKRLDAILGRALATDPTRRFASVTALTEAVTALLFAQDDGSQASPGELTSDAALAATDLAAASTSAASPARDAASVAPAATRLKRGDSLGRYLILDVLGQGGMGAVYSAYDPDLDRRVALKLLLTQGSSQGARKRLVREARALAKLSHPNVVQVHDAGEHQGNVFVAMELVEGVSLKEWATAQTDWKEVLLVYLQAARGLAAAHAAGLVHRDIKPANIVLGQAGPGPSGQVTPGRVRVIDFGLAAAPGRLASDEEVEAKALYSSSMSSAVGLGSSERIRSLEGELDERLTVTGAMMGTPLYMAPEQMISSADVGPQADQYSLCVSLYEALYGQLPFDIAAAGGELAGLWRLKLDTRIVAPGSSPVPGYVRAALIRALAPRPDDRHPSIEALIEALSHDPEAFKRRRLRVGALSLGGLIVAAVAVLVAVHSGAFRDPCGDLGLQLAGVWDGAVREQVRAAFVATRRGYAQDTFARVATRLDAYVETWLQLGTQVCREQRKAAPKSRDDEVLWLRRQCLDRRKSQLGALAAVFSAGPDVTVLDQAVQAAAGLYPIAYCSDDKALLQPVPLPEDPKLRARVEALRARLDQVKALDVAGKYREALPLAKALQREIKNLGHAPFEAEVYFQLGNLHDDVGDYTDAMAAFEQAVFLAARGQDDALAAKGWARLVFVVGGRQQRKDEAERLIAWAPAIIERTRDAEAHALFLHTTGAALNAMGKYAEAKAMYERALALRVQTLGQDHPRVADTLNNLAGVIYHMGKYAETRVLQERALAIRERVLGQDHPGVAQALNNLGVVFKEIGKYAEAKAMYERALVIRERALGQDHPGVAQALNNLGIVFWLTGKYAEARAMHERALAIQQKSLGQDHPTVAGSLNDLGDVFYAMGNYEEASVMQERACGIWEKALGKDHPNLASALTGLGRAQIALGRLEEAESHLVRALSIREHALGKTHPELAQTLLGLGELALARRRPTSAAAVLMQAFSLGSSEFHLSIQLALAEALWAAPKDRPRAVILAQSTLAEARRIGHVPRIERATRWLAAHPLHEGRSHRLE